MKKYLLLLLILINQNWAWAQTAGTTTIGQSPELAPLQFFEYYNHAPSEWVKLFSIKNFNASQGFWGKGGAAGRLYFVDYQGNGGGYVDFAFPQSLHATSKPNITVVGDAAARLKWAAVLEGAGTGQELYTVYVQTPEFHLGLSFLMRVRDFIPYFSTAASPPTAISWSTDLNPESFQFIDGKGNQGMGTMSPNEKLSVNGKIRAKEIKVEAANWPDYVFSPGYEKMSLSEIEQFIKLNGHLPEVPAAAEVEKEGISLGEMNKILLKKIEELTLYLIQKEKELNSVNEENKIRDAKISQLEKLIKLKK